MDDAGLAHVEKQRQELEGRISQLRKSLQHWQTWEIEYDGLREEIASLPPGCSRNEIFESAKDFGAKLVDSEELDNIIGADEETRREQAHIVDLLAKRVEYVSRNVRTIGKQISEVQRNRNALLPTSSLNYDEDCSLPPVEITEEIDDDGNVVSSKVEMPHLAVPQLKDVLKKAGVADEIATGDIGRDADDHSDDLIRHVPQDTDEPQRHDLTEASGIISGRSQIANTTDVKEFSSLVNMEEAIPDNKTDSIRAGTLSLPCADPVSQSAPSELRVASSPKHQREGRREVSEATANRVDDTPEEAALRYDMVQYGLDEMGEIVAELELDEAGSDMSYAENEDEDEGVDFSSDSDFDEDIEDEEESDDETGKAKRPVLSRRYLKKMEMLEAKHGIKAMKNMGPDPSSLPKDVQKVLNMPSAIGPAKQSALGHDQREDLATALPEQQKKDPSKRQKKVSFATDLDIAPEQGPETQLSHRPALRPGRLKPDPVEDRIVERQAPSTPGGKADTGNQSKNRRLSKFRLARESKPQTPLPPPSPISMTLLESHVHGEQQPALPVRQIHSDKVVERNPKFQPKPPDPDEIDDHLHRQEIAGEYHKLRSRMIQYQGGFVGAGEADNYGDEIRPLPMVDEDGKEKKISRFRAARLR